MLDIEVKRVFNADEESRAKSLVVDGTAIEGNVVAVKSNAGRMKVEVFV